MQIGRQRAAEGTHRLSCPRAQTKLIRQECGVETVFSGRWISRTLVFDEHNWYVVYYPNFPKHNALGSQCVRCPTTLYESPQFGPPTMTNGEDSSLGSRAIRMTLPRTSLLHHTLVRCKSGRPAPCLRSVH